MCINCLKITRNNRLTGNTNGEVAVLSPFIRNLLNDDASFNKRHTTQSYIIIIITLTVPFNDIIFFFNFLSIRIKFKSILKYLTKYFCFITELRIETRTSRSKESNELNLTFARKIHGMRNSQYLLNKKYFCFITD